MLIAVGILAVGMLLVAGLFPVGIRFTQLSIEQSTAVAVADEAFAKIKLFGLDFDSSDWDDPVTECVDFNDVAEQDIDESEFEYPSTDIDEPKQYCWSALCRQTSDDPNAPVQVTVFVCRRSTAGTRYPDPEDPHNSTVSIPMPVKVEVEDNTGRPDEIKISNADDYSFINDNYTIVDDETGRIYKVLERYADRPDTILLNKDWQGDFSGDVYVWMVPAPASCRYPCIAVYQRVIIF